MTWLAEFIGTDMADPSKLPWLGTLRKAGMDRFETIGFPTTSQEEWRFTNVAPIARERFVPARAGVTDEARRLFAKTSFGSEAAMAEIVFVNGRHAPELSWIGQLPRGVMVRALSDDSDLDAAWLEPLFAQVADIQVNPFTALNTGSFQDAALLRVQRGAVMEWPIHVLFISTTDDQPTVSHPRLLILAENNSDVKIVETYIGGSGVHLTNAVTEIVAESHCRIDYNRTQQGGNEAFAITTLSARLDRDSQLVSHAATLGGRLTRNDLNVTLAGQHADATLNGLVMVDDRQHCDNHTLLDHAAAHCPSHELYKHVLGGKSSCVFKGKILVRPDSQKTDSKQSSKSLLLSDDATMNSQPALEIYADDVKCTHGSTTGPVDEEMVFYLRSRGVGLDAARHLLTYAFAADITRRIRVEPVRRKLEDFLAAQHGLPMDLRITDLGGHDEKAR